MTNPVTPNIGLNKIDRTSPSTTYFDLEKYIDQNADAVDRFAGESSEAIHALEKRLDTEERREVVLQPGLQIVNAERSAPFKLSGIKGRTLVNLLGRDGSCDSLNGISPYQVTLALDNSQYSQGTALKVTVAQGFSSGAAFIPNVKFYANKKYVLIVDARIENAEYARIHLSGVGAIGNNVTSTTFKPSVAFYSPTADTTSNADLALKGSGSSAIIAYFDAARIYEVSAEEYADLASMTPEQVADKYPYVDSVQPVRNPYAIRYGENLTPSLFEGTVGSSTNIMSAYSALIKATGSTVVQYSSNLVSAIPNTIYTLKAKISRNGVERYDGVYVDVMGYDENGRSVLDIAGTAINGSGIGTDTFSTPANIRTMQVRIVIPENAEIGDYVVEDIMLNIGSTPKPFKPREDAMLVLQTDLYADPLTGVNADEVFEKDGQYFKLAKWKKVVFDGNISYVHYTSYAGAKSITSYIAPLDRNIGVLPYLIKYDGKSLIAGGPTLPGNFDQFSTINWTTTGSAALGLSIPNTDSGWGDNYTPTPDEIKAYFMGWRMFPYEQGDTVPIPPYNGTGTKAWVQLDPTSSTGVQSGAWTTTLPTTRTINTAWQPYQLIYQLVTPTIEPIISEGMFTFNEGDNLIEVGTGFVTRERANPSVYADGYVRINDSSGTGQTLSFLSNKVARIAAIFMNGKRDDRWILRTSPNSSLVNGMGYAYTTVSNYDPSAAYSVNYLMLDKSSIVPFTGTYAANEKAMLQELTDAVQQNATAISVSLEAANKAFQSGVNAKNVMVEAINASLGGASINDSWATLAEKVRSNKGMEVEGFTTAFEYPYSYVPAGSTKVENIYTFDAGLSNIFFIPKKTQKDQAGASYITIVTGGTLMLGCKWHLRDKNGLLHIIASSGPGYWSRGPTLYLLSLQFDLEYKRCYFSYASTETSGGVITTTIPDNFDTSGPVSLVIELEPGTTPPTDSKWKIFMDGKFILG
ncbi:hypothetical protein M4D81_20935 [Paenibacillus sp. p3-SID867]|uniref:hypothetical protein n=1 Tax=Paenibacillus sp. p3-SID867 TaxID=2916363 RepID=UPI0021A7B95D|nr:hypothetical protein [Paenibacillus sp. p3-SID867]MCT1401487.1 hypothetical protein [Paenibacillus sp. p3-SID867]